MDVHNHFGATPPRISFELNMGNAKPILGNDKHKRGGNEGGGREKERERGRRERERRKRGRRKGKKREEAREKEGGMTSIVLLSNPYPS